MKICTKGGDKRDSAADVLVPPILIVHQGTPRDGKSPSRSLETLSSTQQLFPPTQVPFSTHKITNHLFFDSKAIFFHGWKLGSRYRGSKTQLQSLQVLQPSGPTESNRLTCPLHSPSCQTLRILFMKLYRNSSTFKKLKR